jgi:hypothetical protein
MPDKEDSTTSLGHSEILSVQHPPGVPVPEVSHRPEDGSKIPSVPRGQYTGDVFPEDPPGLDRFREPEELEREVSSLIGEPSTEPDDGEGLTRGAANEDVNGADLCDELGTAGDAGEVSIVLHSGVAVSKYGRGEVFDLSEAHGLPAEPMPRA